MQGTLGLAGGLVIDRFFHNNTLFRDGITGCIQLVSFLICFADIGLQIRLGPFFLGQLEPGGWPVQGGVPLGSGGRCLLCGLFSLMPVMGIVGPFQQLFRYAVSLRGIVLFGLPAGNVLYLAGGLIFQREAVAGHGLCHLGFGFQLFQWPSPSV